jgi:Ca2+-binding EF-hand superfamily protein
MVIDRAVKRPQGDIVKNLIERYDKNQNGKIDEEERTELRRFIRNADWLPGSLNNSF